MPKSASLSHFFTNQNLIDVFLFFLLHPREQAYLAQIVDSTGKALIQVQRTLKRLIETGLVQTTIRNNKTFYAVDLKHVAYEDVKNLVIKAKIFSDEFKTDLEILNNKVVYGFIYGSVAKGSNTAQSDIDIFLIGNLKYEDVGPFIFNLGRDLVQEVNVAIFSPSEFLNGIKKEQSFITTVLHEPKIWLFGDKYEFEEIYCKRVPN